MLLFTHVETIMTAQPHRVILLVDDDDSVRTILQQALTRHCCQVIVASDGAEALRQSEAELGKIDLLISDLQMPRLNGIELAQRLRQQRPELPILFISGSPDSEQLLQTAAMANSRFLRKPFLPSALIALLPSLFEPNPEE